MKSTTNKGTPEFLKETIDAHHKDVVEKAVAHYIRDNELTVK